MYVESALVLLVWCDARREDKFEAQLPRTCRSLCTVYWQQRK